MMPHDVTQADRDAAKAIYNAYRKSGLPCEGAAIVAGIRLAAIAEERARVVAYLRTRLIANVGDRFADAIERGDHIQEK